MVPKSGRFFKGGDEIARSLTCVVLLLACCASPLWSENRGGSAEQSVLIVVDLSYSMRLQEPGGMSRMEIMKTGLRRLLRAPVAGVEWAIAGFDDVESIRSYQSFTTDHRSLLGAVASLQTGRLSPVEEALRFGARYLLDNARGVDRKVLLVSDGISTQSAGFAFGLPAEFERERLPLFVLGFDHSRNPQLLDPLRRISAYTGGAYFTFSEVDALKGELLQPWNPGERQAFGPAPMAGAGASGTVEADRRGSVYYLIPLLLAVLLFGLVAFVRYRLAAERRRFTREKREPRVFLHLTIEGPEGQKRSIRTSESPLRIGTESGCQICLEQSRRRVMFTYRWDAGRAEIVSDQPFLLNGVAVRSKLLRRGDRLKCDSYRLFFEDLEVEKIEAPSLQDYSLYPLAAGVFSLFVFVLMFSVQKMQARSEEAAGGGDSLEESVEAVEEVVVEEPGSSAAESASPAAEAPSAPAASIVEAPTAEAAAPAVPETALLEKPPSTEPAVTRRRESAYSGEPPSRPQGALATTPVSTVAPGEAVPFRKLDILFIHAHPDDESLDFGGLIARAADSGKRIAAVLFTDGEAGLDQFPDRPLDGIYSPEELSGRSLAEVRIREADTALSILGCPVYVRLGRKNHPYDSSRDVMEVESVLEAWGGREAVGRSIRALIEGFRPEVIVSSDANPDAYEHYEHKAVGWITREITTLLRREELPGLRGHLMSVDPFQTVYEDQSELWHLDLMQRRRESGYTYREIQMAALKEHQTQGDASLIGVELLPNFGTERYLPVFWDMDVSLEQYLSL